MTQAYMNLSRPAAQSAAVEIGIGDAVAETFGRVDEAPSAADTDDGLLERIAANDQNAFRLLVERHIDRAYGLALRILNNRADAEDIVQDTLLKIWLHRGRWESGRAKFSTWLYRVVTNRCIDYRRQPRTEDLEQVPEVADAKPLPIEELQKHKVTSLLDAAMERLPEQQRIALILSYHENMNNSEVAEVMQTTVMAVESLLKRGRQKLRELLRRSEKDIRGSFTDD
ncbi:RNA polymerase sigma factor [Pseudolabrys taiwanensis]|uniref:RNA polymerase sigma factor n=2 Tax=Pseudolabrys taiwanensis TaxID=331696 RepID=A0A346A4D8_9HYPH|nr:RNA polymerase sigma factor [Pseudolabrys taiwanensis]